MSSGSPMPGASNPVTGPPPPHPITPSGYGSSGPMRYGAPSGPPRPMYGAQGMQPGYQQPGQRPPYPPQTSGMMQPRPGAPSRPGEPGYPGGPPLRPPGSMGPPPPGSMKRPADQRMSMLANAQNK
ncbi:unnamed protein product, partial [Cyprideis torosa]